MWTDLVQAYESRLAILEEARAEYTCALVDLIGHVGPAMNGAVRAALADAETDCRVDAATAESGEHALMASAPWSIITVSDDLTGTEFRIASWVASSWGGPPNMLRVAISLEKVHDALDLKAWTSKCGEQVEASVPGEPFDPFDWMKVEEASPDWSTIRIATIGLADCDFPQAARAAGDVARAFAETIPPMFMLIGDALMPTLKAEKALLEYRPTLEGGAQRAGVSLSPVRGLGFWRGGKYLQVGGYWLATDPVNSRLVASCNSQDRRVLAGLAAELDCSIDAQGTVAVLNEGELRDSGVDAGAVISSAFDHWFETKASEITTSDGDGLPVNTGDQSQ